MTLSGKRIEKMSSRRRNSKKNLGNSISDIQRRLRRMERRPIRTRLQNRVIKGAAIAPSSITADEVGFGTAIVSSDPENDVLNPKDGLLVVDPDTGAGQLYNERDGEYVALQDTVAQASANGKNKIYYSTTAPSGTSYNTGDTWFDTNDGYKIYTWNGTSWSGFELGSNAIASISATKILAGELAAGVIVTSAIDAGQISAGTINAAISMTSASITGGIIQQGSSGNYILMDQTNKATIKFNVTGFTQQGYITVESSFGGDLGEMRIAAPAQGTELNEAMIGLYNNGSYGDISISTDDINIESQRTFQLGNPPDGIQLKYDVDTTTNLGGEAFVYSIRNTWQSLNSRPPGGADGRVGDIWLTY